MTTEANNPRELAVMVGATGAIGKFVAHRLVAQGLDLLAVGRSEKELKLLSETSPHIRYCVADISEDSAIATIAQHVDKTVRMAIHAPGVPVAGGVLEASPLVLGQAVNIKAGGMLRLFARWKATWCAARGSLPWAGITALSPPHMLQRRAWRMPRSLI